jgi:N-acetylglucosamine-6-phosphate deacetylase
MAQIAWKAKGRDGLTLISDASAAQGMSDGIYSLGDFQIQVRGPLCTLMDGMTIASSVVTMNAAARNAMEFTGMNLVDAAYTASLMPAKACGVEKHKGSIEVGKDADLAILDPDFSVACTVRAGVAVFQNRT